MRSSIVRTESLANFSRSCGFGEFLRLGHGEEKMGGRDRETTLENLFEAFLGALFIDQGMDEVRKFIQHVVIPHVKNDDYVKVIDYKTELQEVLQIGGETTISYKILKEEGPAHDRSLWPRFLTMVKNSDEGLENLKKLQNKKQQKMQ